MREEKQRMNKGRVIEKGMEKSEGRRRMDKQEMDKHGEIERHKRKVEEKRKRVRARWRMTENEMNEESKQDGQRVRVKFSSQYDNGPRVVLHCIPFGFVAI